MRTYRATVQVGNRSFSEIVNMGDYREYFDESTACENNSWDEWTRPVETEDLDSLNGNHMLFGYIEGLWQSDYSPMFCLTEFNKLKTITYRFE